MAACAGSVFVGMFTAYIGATAYLIYRDDLLGAAVSRQVSMQYAYEERIAALRSELDRLSSRHAVQTSGVEEQLAELLDKQALIERRQSALDGIVSRARASGVEVASVAAASVEPLSYAPTDPKPDDPITGILERQQKGPRISSHDAAIRPALSNVRTSLDQAEDELTTALDAVGTAAGEEVGRLTDALAPIGVDAGGPAEASEEPEGGPFVPATGLHFVERTALVNRTLDDIDALRHAAFAKPVGMPVNTTRISSRFGNRLDPFLKRPAFHAGIDFVATAGTVVRSTAPGVVVEAGWNGGYGQMVEVKHADGVSTRYGHLSKILVSVGDQVETGSPVGRVGSTGRSTGPHLHYETLRNGKSVNPAVYLAAGKALRTGL
jgi:murein DD-endopeptidase MepM/ murein hydrolase activator NlpD